MTVTCPEGHRSEATDYCDTCGTPIAPAGPDRADGSTGLSAGASADGPPSVPGAPAPQPDGGSVLDLDPAPAATLSCPHCGAVNIADALFCEACGYDFTTGAAPMGAPQVDQPDNDQLDVEESAAAEPEAEEPAAPEQEVGQADVAGPETSQADLEEPEVDEPAPGGPELDEPGPGGPEVDEPVTGEAGGDHGDAEQQVVTGSGAEEPQVDEGDAAVEAEDLRPEAATDAPVPAHVRPRHAPPSRDLADAWVVEVWVDPDWYAVQQTDEACPSPGLPDVVVVRRNVVLVGRPSGSLGVRPDVDAGADSAVSRRHAQLTSDGTRWWVEDLGSSNGTYVGSVGEPLPTAPIRQRVEIDRDDRIFVGAWTRLVLRQATAAERAGEG